MVEAAQARVRELDVLSQLAQVVPHAQTKLLAVSALR